MSKSFSIKDRIRSFRFAFQGLFTLAKEEHNFRIHLAACVVVITAGFSFGVSASDWRWLVICMGISLTAEAFNTIVEYLVDLKQPEQDPLAGKIKDIAAAAMLITAITALIIGVIVFLPYAQSLLTS